MALEGFSDLPEITAGDVLRALVYTIGYCTLLFAAGYGAFEMLWAWDDDAAYQVIEIGLFAWVAAFGFAIVEGIHSGVLRPRGYSWQSVGWSMSGLRYNGLAVALAVIASVCELPVTLPEIAAEAHLAQTEGTQDPDGFLFRWYHYTAFLIGLAGIAIGITIFSLGLVYRALRSRLSLWPAATSMILITTLPILPLFLIDDVIVFGWGVGTVILGFGGAWLFERTGSVMPAYISVMLHGIPYAVLSELAVVNPALFSAFA